MVKFRCKRSGNIVSFSDENDIAGLRKHEGYTEVSETVVKAESSEKEGMKNGSFETFKTHESNNGHSHENGENAEKQNGYEKNALQDAGYEEKRQVLKRGRPKKAG